MKRRTVYIISFLIFITLFFFPFEKTVCIRNRKNPSDRICSRQALEGFCVSYTHSVNKGRVHDYYRIQDGQFIIYRTEFSSYGAGMPEIQETPGAVFKIDGNTFAMEYERTAGKNFLLAVGVTADHSVTINQKEYHLQDFFAPQTGLEFCIKKISLFEKISGGSRWKTPTIRWQKILS